MAESVNALPNKPSGSSYGIVLEWYKSVLEVYKVYWNPAFKLNFFSRDDKNLQTIVTNSQPKTSEMRGKFRQL
jgi:hypothetical protein